MPSMQYLADGLGPPPDKVRVCLFSAGFDRSSRAQVKHIALNLHHARLSLPQPIREQRHKHRMGQGLLFLVGLKRAAIGDVTERLFLDLLVASAKPVARRELGTAP